MDKAGKKNCRKGRILQAAAIMQGSGGLRATALRNPRLVDDDSDIKKPGRQRRRLLLILPKLYPPDGKVPDRVATEKVRQQVISEEQREAKALGRAIETVPGVSWATVHRALGRRR